MSTLPKSGYYVYVLARPNGKPFYVGKGKGQRIYGHDAEARKGHKCHKCNVIRKLWAQGQDFQRYIVLTTESEKEAHSYERELIALYGRKNLCNLTDGGEGVSGRVVSEKTRRKLSQKLRGKPGSRRGAKASEETRRKMSAALRGRKRSPEQIEANRQRQLGKKLPPEQIEGIRQRMLGNTYGAALKGRPRKPLTEEARHKISETLKATRPWKGKKHSTDSVQKMRAAQARPYRVTLPTGEVIEVTHLKTFCAEQGISYSAMVAAGTHNRTHVGYGVEPLNPRPKSQKPRKLRDPQTYHRKNYLITAPDGREFTTSDLPAFCVEHKLNYRSVLNTIATGKLYKGWTVRRAV